MYLFPPGLSITAEAKTVWEFVNLDGTRVVEKIIGVGGMGIVIQQRQYAIKIPQISRVTEIDGVRVAGNGSLTPKEGDYDARPDLIKLIEIEKAIYQRLGDHPGIVRCYNSSSTDHSIQMDFMKNGDLRHYLALTRPESKIQLLWLTKIARTMVYIHQRRVIIGDIRLDNFLLDDELDVKFVDFNGSTLMPLDWNLDGSDDLGSSILTDIGQFGSAMFTMVTGQNCKSDVFRDEKEVGHSPVWQQRCNLPSTSNVWLGYIIEKCWTQGFRSAEDLAAELDKQDALAEKQ